ncbi:Assembly factor CBP4 [Wallemia ichthyophaga EXF-994]|uniref:Assembly factor CBP4 n=1 Tax=Wallemia ichthyophaga (strain EXF-994 / CBS 113033) TaxID=1299270 RepID=R9AEU3_WALI9|nr:Assembly factor CBP4 [Wallemia ichthyophaga EXF-994]EOR00655.1 Assembly factor CBP4 [Wallemia ichthyophaga EXF-994]
MVKIAWGRWAFWSSVIMGSGYGLMVGLTPSDEELYNKLSPDLKRKVDHNRKEREKMEAMSAKERAV